MRWYAVYTGYSRNLKPPLNLTLQDLLCMSRMTRVPLQLNIHITYPLVIMYNTNL